jgi:hypothetical protein
MFLILVKSESVVSAVEAAKDNAMLIDAEVAAALLTIAWAS